MQNFVSNAVNKKRAAIRGILRALTRSGCQETAHMPWYRSLPAIVKTIWPALHRQQGATLALLVELILRQRSLCLTDLARGSFVERAFATRYQQLWRWTQNERIDSRALRRALAAHALAWCAGHGQYLPVIVDTTACRQFRVLQAILPRRRRGLPLLWHTYQHGTMREQVTSFQLAFLDELHDVLADARAAGRTPVLIGDRGFARSAILAWCEQHDWAYLVRLPQSWRIAHRWYRGTLGQFTLAPGQVRRFVNIRCGPRRRFTATLVATRLSRRAAQILKRRLKTVPPQWYLLTTTEWTAAQTVAWYRRRWWIESTFRDAKQHLGLTTVRVTTVAAFDRLLVAWMLGLQLALAIGLKVLTAAHERQLGHPKRLGLVAKAVLFLERQEHVHQPSNPGRPLDLWAALWAGNPPPLSRTACF
jgi:hypothetical protein